MFRKKIISIFIFLFAFSQVYGFFHNAKHDFKSHKHNSQICSTYLNHSKSKDCISDFFFLSFTFKTIPLKKTAVVSVLISQDTFTLFLPRSPPFILI